MTESKTCVIAGSLPLPVLGMYVLPTFPQWEPFSRMWPWEKMCENHLGGLHDWTLLRPVYKLLRFWRVGVEIYSPSKKSHICKFPCLLTLPPTSLEWLPLSSFCLCPLCTGASLWILCKMQVINSTWEGSWEDPGKYDTPSAWHTHMHRNDSSSSWFFVLYPTKSLITKYGTSYLLCL